MRKTLLIIATVFITLPSMAQYNGEAGFYRIKNKGEAERYISICNDRVDSQSREPKYSSGFNFDPIPVYSLSTIKNPISNAGSVLYISGSPEDLSLEAQGMDTKSLLRNYQLKNNGQYLYSTISQIGEVFLVDHNDPYDDNEDENAYIAPQSQIDSYSRWEIIKIDNKEEYFGVAPEVKVGNKYYTTLYTSFAYELPDDMKAYYVDDHEYKTISEPGAELIEIKDKVPAATPVILECASNKPEDNKLKPLDSSDAPAPVSFNELVGVYFCYYMKSSYAGYQENDNQDNVPAKELKNVTAYNASTMRVLGVMDNKLSLVPAKDDQLVITKARPSGNTYKYIKANTAYFPIKSTEASATKDGIKLMTKEEFKVATSIKSINEEKTEKSGIYTLTGVRVKADNSAEGLTNGIYIINGKKVIIK